MKIVISSQNYIAVCRGADWWVVGGRGRRSPQEGDSRQRQNRHEDIHFILKNLLYLLNIWNTGPSKSKCNTDMIFETIMLGQPLWLLALEKQDTKVGQWLFVYARVRFCWTLPRNQIEYCFLTIPRLLSPYSYASRRKPKYSEHDLSQRHLFYYKRRLSANQTRASTVKDWRLDVLPMESA
jgi:hypothetical protein